MGVNVRETRLENKVAIVGGDKKIGPPVSKLFLDIIHKKIPE
jgi:hypothetical protein